MRAHLAKAFNPSYAVRRSRSTIGGIRRRTPHFDEPLRPQFHFSQKQGWNNDPNGMVYYDGEYHLFWQCNPVGVYWNNMYWGHAVSKDMVYWTELPRALRSCGDFTTNLHPSLAKGNCFSGSGNVDFNNSAGWQTGKEKTMIAAFTDTGHGAEVLAYSNDRGRNWTYYTTVIKHRGRDPKLIWYEPGKHWVIAVYDERKDRKGGIAFYKGTNLKDWKYCSRIEEFSECPELFQLPVDGNKNDKRLCRAVLHQPAGRPRGVHRLGDCQLPTGDP